MNLIDYLLVYVICHCWFNSGHAACGPLHRRKGVDVTCRNPTTRSTSDCQRSSTTVRIGTIAEYRCAKFYVHVNLLEEAPRSPTLTCGEDSKWSNLADYNKFFCQPDCGRLRVGRSLQPLIIGGRPTNATLWPWHATIYNSGKYYCGGTLINAFNHGLVILTAAHCFFNSRNEPVSKRALSVVLGARTSDLRSNERDRTAQVFKIDRIMYHADYGGDTSDFANDIAIVKLDGSVRLTEYVSPVCLSASEDLAEEQLVIESSGETVGFGHYDQHKHRVEISPSLLHAVLPVVQRRRCQQWRRSPLKPEEFCAGHAKGVAVCKGDSGGGLVFDHTRGGRSRYYIQGIVSHGFVKNGVTCENFGVFTRVNSYVNWIHEQVASLQIGEEAVEEEPEKEECPSCEPTVCPKTNCGHQEFKFTTALTTTPTTTTANAASTSTTTRRNFISWWHTSTSGTTESAEPEFIPKFATSTTRPVFSTTTTTTEATTALSQPLPNNFPEYQKLALQIHNYYRSLHSVPPLRLNEMLNNEARKYAEKLIREGTFVNKNDPGYTSETLPFLKNIFQLRETGGSLPITQTVNKAVTSWYNGIKNYNWRFPQATTFSQVVWKSTTELGIGYATGIEDSARRTVVVATYAPPGNIHGKYEHERNVFTRN